MLKMTGLSPTMKTPSSRSSRKDIELFGEQPSALIKEVMNRVHGSANQKARKKRNRTNESSLDGSG